jgi:hypothetical protein
LIEIEENRNFSTFRESLPYGATTEIRETAYEMQGKKSISSNIFVFRLERHDHNILILETAKHISFCKSSGNSDIRGKRTRKVSEQDAEGNV